MPKISSPTSRTINPPLLIDAVHLDALDRIVDRHLPDMREYKNRKITDQAARKVREWVREGALKQEQATAYEEKFRKELLNRYDYRESRSVSLYLTKGREIQARQFSEAISQPVGDDEIVSGFSLLTRVGEIQATVKAGAESWQGGMTVEVKPNDNEIAQALFGALSNWASDIEAPKWQQKWSQNTWLAGMLLFALLGVGAILIPLSNWGDAGKSAAKEEARKLLSEGSINPTNEQRAIELLLAIESDYRPASVRTPPLGPRYWSYVSLGALILLAVTVCPALCIGLWKGKRRLHAWRVWVRTLTIGIPSLIGVRVLLPWILYWLNLGPPSH